MLFPVMASYAQGVSHLVRHRQTALREETCPRRCKWSELLLVSVLYQDVCLFNLRIQHFKEVLFRLNHQALAWPVWVLKLVPPEAVFRKLWIVGLGRTREPAK